MMDSHEHEQHGHGDTSSRRKLGGVTLINAIGFLVELAGGILFGSVALMGDAIHMLFDASAYATAYGAARVAESRDASGRWTYGFHRVEVISALINGLLLVPMSGYIIWTAYQRFQLPVAIDAGPALAVAVFGLLVNAVSVHYLREEGHMSLNERGAFYHLLGDAGGSVAVILGVVAATSLGVPAADPVAAVLIAVMVIWSAGRVILDASGILLQKSPVDPEAIREAVESVAGVADAHDIRAWCVCSSVNVCTVHARMTVETLEEAEQVRKEIDARLKEKFNLQHITLQVEQGETGDNHVAHGD